MDNKKINSILEKTGALKRGHFKLSSGLHSEYYLQCALVLQHSEYAEFLGKELAKKLKGLRIDAVISPAVGGLIIGHEVARALKKRAIFAERVAPPLSTAKRCFGNQQGAGFTLRRGFEIRPGEKILVVEDVVTTGKSSLEVGNMVESMGANIAGYAAICDRSSKRINFEKAFYNLIRFEFKTYSPEVCPLCHKKVPVDTPGSRFTPHSKGAK
jgi:orotate phosphoribosyltransferase